MKPAPVPAKCLPATKISGIASAPSRAGITRYDISASKPMYRATPALSQVIGKARRYGMPDGMTAPFPSARALAANDVVSSSPKNPRSPRPENRIHPAIRVMTISRIQIASRSRFSVMQANLRRNASHTPEMISVPYLIQPGLDSQVNRSDQSLLYSVLRQPNATLAIKVHAMHSARRSAEASGSKGHRIRPTGGAQVCRGALLARIGVI